jgi:hypothetical protein
MGSFSLELQRFNEKTQQRADEVVGLVVAKIAQRLDARSPVGDASYWKHPAPKGYVGGRFRGNWQLGVAVVPSGETGRIDPGGGSTVSAIISEIPTKAAGLVYYLANNVPYAQRIEEGWSRQAPTGLVGLTVTEFQPIVAEAAGSAA